MPSLHADVEPSAIFDAPIHLLKILSQHLPQLPVCLEGGNLVCFLETLSDIILGVADSSPK